MPDFGSVNFSCRRRAKSSRPERWLRLLHQELFGTWAIVTASEMTGVLDHRFEAGRLMVIVPDRLSDLIAKGEITERYYNPGELFREVHLVLTNEDRPDVAALQQTVGAADLHLHNMPTAPHFFARTLGWQPLLMRSWTNRMVRLAQSLKPDLIRCHGADLNAYAAAAIREAMNVRFVVSSPYQSRAIGGRLAR